MTAVHKYKAGTKLEVLKPFNSSGIYYNKGDVIEIRKGKEYPKQYEIVGHPDVGWAEFFIEDSTKFKIFEITNWKKELGGI